MKKIFVTIIIILIAGLYIDAKNVGPYCNANSYQPTFVIQSIIPFRVDRQTFLFGYGKKISNFPLSDQERYTDLDGYTSAWSSTTRCVVYLKDGKPVEEDGAVYIDLKFWEKAK